MAYTTANRTAGFSFRAFADKFIADIKANHARHQAYRTTFDELSRLSDRELNDIGIGRSDIRYVAQQEADRH